MYFQNFFINIYNLSSYDSHLMSHNILYYSFGSILTVIKTWKFHPTFGWVESTIWCINRERDVQSWKIVDMYSQKGFFSMVQSKSYSFIRFSLPTWLMFWSTTKIILPNHKFSNKLRTLIEPNEQTYLYILTYLLLYATDILLEIFQFPIMLKMLILASDIHILSLESRQRSRPKPE